MAAGAAAKGSDHSHLVFQLRAWRGFSLAQSAQGPLALTVQEWCFSIEFNFKPEMKNQHQKRAYVIQKDGRKVFLEDAAQLVLEWGEDRVLHLDLSPHPWGLVITDPAAATPTGTGDEADPSAHGNHTEFPSTRILLVRSGGGNVLFIDAETLSEGAFPTQDK